jgi:chromosome segregation protein
VRELEEQIDAQQRNLDALKHAREELDTKREELLEEEARINMDILSMRKDMQAKEEAVAALRRRKAAHEGRVGDLNDEIAGIAKESLDIKAGIARMREQVQSLREQSAQSKASVAALVTERGEFEAKNSALRAQERNKTAEKEKLGGELARLEERKSTLEKELEDSRNKLYDEYQLTLREAEDLGIVLEEPSKAARRLAEIRNKIRALGSVNVGAVEEYKEVSERYTFLGGQIRDIEQSREELTRLIEELTGKMAERFREQFAKINSHFGETFAELFDGGKAELVLENRMDVLECNIEIKVQPPGKNVQNIDLLSGGEKGLAAISLLFAILKVTPAPFCIFDEVEAALDENNVVRFAKYVRRMTGNTQFILITHRRGTMEEADILYGVTMQEDGVSKLLELKTTEMAKRLGIA